MTGMVPALYDDGEKDALISSVREEVVAAGHLDSKEACWAHYVAKCRNNLHVVLAMSPVGETLRTRCRNFPGMVNNTVIDWFEPWPEQVGVGLGPRLAGARSVLAGMLLLSSALEPPATMHVPLLLSAWVLGCIHAPAQQQPARYDAPDWRLLRVLATSPTHLPL